MIELFIGHILGDYLFQNDWMALNKKKEYLPAVVHCLIYSILILVCSGLFDVYFFAAIFFSHFVLDKYSVLIRWFQLSRPTTFKQKDDGSYSTLAIIIYIVTDNSIHLIGNYYLYKYFMGV